MAKASFSWQQLINESPHWSLLNKTGSPKHRTFKPLSGPGGILGFFTVIVAMLLWNWKLLLALMFGVGVMLLVYSMQKWDWQLRLSRIYQFLNSPNSRLALAVISGGIATISTYMAAAIWVDSTSSWIAAGAIVQGLATLLTLVLLMWQIVSFYGNQQQKNLDQLLINLTAEDPLKRLIAIRQLAKIVTSQRVDSQVQQDVVQCLQLLLSQEQETVIRDAALESLQAWDSWRSLPSSQVTAFTPLSTKLKVPIS
ncbi:armadillo-type fold-containing protein [Nodularia harveyana UHCC-0300]|uniref:Armadillo-type fold-containing protein n=1 Tax=Nodularia harveyana UHCC-0300 TaxID=2974287 RepID=A0ABU5UEI4_9CYAN|nr:armadillo-type fold-containing protein [Nodularia harveyana]MEA5581939.1 armadillo-type fold-containing protein [Nodularia harveyana UHCC-0300]